MSVQIIIVAVLFALMGIGAFVRPRTFVSPLPHYVSGRAAGP